MKLYKFFALALAAVTMTACSNDDEKVDWNSAANVKVEMQKASVSFKEGKGMVNVPIVVEGDANGNVMVTVSCEETGLNPAQEDVHYYMTTKSLIISPEDKVSNLEINVIDYDEDINDPRTFDIKIVGVKGAEAGEQNFTSVTIKDNDGDFYDKMAGRWNVNFIDYDGAESTAQVNLVAFDEDEEGYNKYYIMTGLMTNCSIEVDYIFDPDTKTGRFEIPYGQYVATVSFTGLGALPVYLFELTPDGYINDEGGAVGEWSADLMSVTFADQPNLGYFPLNGSKFLLWDTQQIISFNR